MPIGPWIGAAISGISSLLGGKMSSDSAKANAAADRALQKEFAQNGISWRVEDAKRAGIHPLYALGAQTTSYSPVAVGDTSMGSALANAGQDISRAIDAGRSAPERLTAYGKTVQDLTLTLMGLENELLASQIAKVRQAGHPPGVPAGGVAEMADVAGQPLQGPVAVAGGVVPPSRLFSDVQVYQQRYGEPAEWVMAPFVAAADAGEWMRGKWIDYFGADAWRPWNR